MRRWLKQFKGHIGTLIKADPIPDLPNSLAPNVRVQTTIRLNIDLDGKPGRVQFWRGDGRTISSLDTAIQHWRWLINVVGDSVSGVCVEIECEWKNTRFSIRQYKEVGPLCASQHYPVRAEKDGVLTWMRETSSVEWTGWVRVLLSLGADGQVEDATMVEGNRQFENAAITSAKEWRFKATANSFPLQLTLSIARINDRPLVGYGVADVAIPVQSQQNR